MKRYNFIVIPAIVFVLGVFGCIRLVQYYDATWKSDKQSTLNTVALTHSLYLTRHIDKTISAAYILGSIVKQNNGSTDNFDTYAHDIYRSIGHIDNLQLAPNGVIEKIYPLKGHEQALGHDLIHDDKRKKEALLAIQSKQLTLAGPFELVQGGVAIIGRYPIFLTDQQGKDAFWGFSSVLIYLDELLNLVGLNEITDEYDYQLSRLHPDSGEIEVFSGKQMFDGVVSKAYAVKVPNGEWLLKIGRKDTDTHAPFYHFAGLAAFILPSILAAFLFFLIRQPILLSELVGIKTKELEQLALYDSLTGLVNRYEFERGVDKFISHAKANDTQHVLCYMDLDQFKVVNDTCGHAAGDELLRQICRHIEKSIRQSDIFARLGGDEFGLLMGNCSLKNGYRVAENIWKSVQDYELSLIHI